jgi:flagellar biosynthesis/type III secretory pathway M-ring protein FliF/YscJ
MSGPFAAPPTPFEVNSGPSVSAMVVQWAPMIGQVLGVLVVVLFLRGLFKKSRGPIATSEAEAVEAEEKDLSPEEQQKRMRREIERTIASDPAAMAKMLETWLLEQKA